MSPKPKPKLPAGWDVYTNANRKAARRSGSVWWKYAIWAIVLSVLAGLAFFPWPVVSS